MSSAVKLEVPAQGQKITVSNGRLQVPDQPIVPFIEGDGTGPDIWRASVRVLDAAVAKAYGGQRQIHWLSQAIDHEEPLMITTTPATVDAGTRRQLAVDLFNHVWSLLETPDRTPLQDDEMLHAAHASRFHWGEVGEPANLARGEWQCSRVYAVLERGEPALWHARRCLALCEEHGIADWDVAFAWEAIARASRVAGDPAATEAALARARELAAEIAEDEDRELLLGDLATI